MTDMITQLRTMPNQQSTDLLQGMTVKSLKELAQEAGISVAGNKDRIVGQIVNHYGYRRINEAMAQRPPMAR